MPPARNDQTTTNINPEPCDQWKTMPNRRNRPAESANGDRNTTVRHCSKKKATKFQYPPAEGRRGGRNVGGRGAARTRGGHAPAPKPTGNGSTPPLAGRLPHRPEPNNPERNNRPFASGDGEVIEADSQG